MEEVEIKYEFEQPQCRACLSVGRKLLPLAEYVNIYKKITSEYYQDPTCMEQARVCWECRALLHKVSQFQLKVMKATEMLQLGQSFIYGTLSNLTTIVFNETYPHTIYVNDHRKVQADLTKAETCMKTDNLPIDSHDLSDNDGFAENDQTSPIEQELETDINAVIKPVIVSKDNIKKISTSRSTNRWAKKRALQNKKAKFRIVTNKDFRGDMVRRVQIGLEDLRRCLQTERDSEYFKSERFKCKDCVLIFNTERSLMKHNKRYHKKYLRPYTCDICHTRTASKTDMSTHVEQHHFKFDCMLCEFSCCNRARANKHVDEHRKVFQCLKCGLKFGSRRDFFKHFKECHEKFICDYCGISFKMRYCIKDHIRKQHSPFECKVCDKRFARYNGLWLHNKTRHAAPLAAAPAYCVECDKPYADVYRYRWHLANSARHTPRKRVRIPCPGCEKVFSKNIYMKDHYNLVHLKCYKYRCDECDKNFVRNADLVKHRRRVHEGVLPPKDKVCYVCGRGFSTNKILTNHVRTHTGERPHACAACPARFAQRAALRGHQRALHHQGH